MCIFGFIGGQNCILMQVTVSCLCELSMKNVYNIGTRPRDYSTLFSYSTQLSITFILLINVKMPIIVVILTFINRINIISDLRSLKQVKY